jgi:hypothetical protein
MAPSPKVAARLELRKKHPHVWICAEEGDEIVGQVVDLDSAWSDVKNGFYPLITLKVESGTGYAAGTELKVHAMPTVLFNEVVKRQPMPGETIKIIYTGTGEPSRKGRSGAELFQLRIKGRSRQSEAERIYGQFGHSNGSAPTGREVPDDDAVDLIEAAASAPVQEEIPF